MRLLPRPILLSPLLMGPIRLLIAALIGWARRRIFGAIPAPVAAPVAWVGVPGAAIARPAVSGPSIAARPDRHAASKPDQRTRQQQKGSHRRSR